MQIELRSEAAGAARRAHQACHDGAAAAQRGERQRGNAEADEAEADAPAAQRAGDGSEKLAFQAGRFGAVTEFAAQQIADRGARWRRGLEHPCVVGPGETAAVVAAAPEEIVIAAAGERISV